MGIIKYIKETNAEMKHTTWPTTNQAILFTILIVVSSLLLSLFLGAFDSLFTNGLKALIG